MKNIYFAVLAIYFLVSCTGRVKYNAEDFKKQQTEYEQKKARLNRTKGKFYKEHKEALLKLVKITNKLIDTATVFKDIPSDTNFFLADVLCRPINYIYSNYLTTSHEQENQVNIIFLDKMDNNIAESSFTDPLKELRACYKNNSDLACINIKKNKLKSILGLKYAFLVNEILRVDPKAQAKGFESGLYFAQLICYDLIEDKPVLTFVASATSSESIQVFSESQQNVQLQLQQDFRKNIQKGIMDACKKHFMF
jgi:hypothetical protein